MVRAYAERPMGEAQRCLSGRNAGELWLGTCLPERCSTGDWGENAGPLAYGPEWHGRV
jgi:hypothetical protein